MNEKRFFGWYLAALLVWWGGAVVAAWHYPGGFDWEYTVISALASQKHNPAGFRWFAGGVILSVVLLWPYVSALSRRLDATRPSAMAFAIAAFRLGLICSGLLGLERLLVQDLSHWIYKGHELIALFVFLGLYGGILGLLLQLMRRNRMFILPVLLVVAPLLAIGVNQLWLYLEQRDLGWVDRSWREMGIPLWHSFAFWQWLSMAFLWAGAGLPGVACLRQQKDGAKGG